MPFFSQQESPSKNSEQACCVGGSYMCFRTLKAKRKKYCRMSLPQILQCWPPNLTHRKWNIHCLYSEFLEPRVTEEGSRGELLLPQHLHLGIAWVLFWNHWRIELLRECFLQDLVNSHVSKMVKEWLYKVKTILFMWLLGVSRLSIRLPHCIFYLRL